MIVRNKNTSECCWNSKQMCFRAEYVKHIQMNTVILAYSAEKVYCQNKQKTVFDFKGAEITYDK